MSMSLNLSVSKQKWAFTKSARFPQINESKQNFTKDVDSNTFNKVSDFDRTVRHAQTRGSSHAFGVKDNRFKHLPSSLRVPSVNPCSYETNRTAFSPEIVRTNSKVRNSSRYTFGEGRNKMTKTFVDEIIHKAGARGEHSPGPNRYSPSSSFGEKGVKLSMQRATRNNGLRNAQFDASFYEAQKQKLPGPGQYALPNEISSSKVASSVRKTAPASKFALATDRFLPTSASIDSSPAPDQYSPRAELGIDVVSKQPKVPRAAFNKAKRDGCDRLFNIRSARLNPGPGAYERVSDFNV